MTPQILEKYLNSVRSCLPDSQRDDIVQELSENLHAQIEGRDLKCQATGETHAIYPQSIRVNLVAAAEIGDRIAEIFNLTARKNLPAGFTGTHPQCAVVNDHHVVAGIPEIAAFTAQPLLGLIPAVAHN